MAMAAEMRQLPVGPKDYRRGEYEETLPLVAPNRHPVAVLALCVLGL